jgi:hypothetical protein
MHWFRRAAISVVIGVFSCICAFNVFLYFQNMLKPYSDLRVVILLFLVPLFSQIIGVSIYGLLTRYFHPKRLYFDGETRCRKCGYILRGIREPICSECGERI